MHFSDLQLSDDVLRAVTDAGYIQPTPIQEQAIPYILMGRDLLGCAQTGTGKTASFTLPMIDILAAGRAKARMPRSLIIEPTRELAAQVAEAFDLYGKHHKLSKALLIGGESMADQLRVLERGADVLIATPGRLLDVFDRGKLLLNDVRILVIDEADRMLDMGFIPDVERIVSLVSRNRQTLFFSATMPPAIRRLADAFLTNPKEIIIAPPATPAATVAQSLIVVAHDDTGGLKEKRAALRTLIDGEEVTSALIFCNRKRDVGVVHRSLLRHGYDAGMLHGDLAQATRTEVLDRFRRGETRLLVCSDVAARGLDIEAVSHVFNFDVPSHAEDYVHRIGRTGRAGRSGRALTVAVPEDGKHVAAIELLIGGPIPRLEFSGISTADLSLRDDRRRRRRNGARPERSERSRRSEKAPSLERGSQPPAEGRRGGAVSAGGRPGAAAAGSRGGVDKRTRAAQNERGPVRRAASRIARDSEAPVVGMGDHVPAFLLREPRLGKKA
jgi:superfamily II DNA/RNA helicase